MAEKLMFIIPIYIFDSNEEDKIEWEKNLGIDKDEQVEIKQAPLYTLYIDCYWIDPHVNSETKTKDIVFYVGGNSYRTPFTQKIINEVIHPAMHVKAAINPDSDTKFITGPN